MWLLLNSKRVCSLLRIRLATHPRFHTVLKPAAHSKNAPTTSLLASLSGSSVLTTNLPSAWSHSTPRRKSGPLRQPLSTKQTHTPNAGPATPTQIIAIETTGRAQAPLRLLLQLVAALSIIDTIKMLPAEIALGVTNRAMATVPATVWTNLRSLVFAATTATVMTAEMAGAIVVPACVALTQRQETEWARTQITTHATRGTHVALGVSKTATIEERAT